MLVYNTIYSPQYIDLTMGHSKIHESHPEILVRLKRAEGQLRSVREMIESERPCLEVAQQLQAAASAIHEAKRSFINDHLDHCLDEAVGADPRKARAQLAAFKAITKYL